MTEQIDYASEAWDLLIDARDANAPEASTAFATAAVAAATLALVEQQRIENIMRLESMSSAAYERLSLNTNVSKLREGLGL